jgi:hypothetical protein
VSYRGDLSFTVLELRYMYFSSEAEENTVSTWD